MLFVSILGYVLPWVGLAWYLRYLHQDTKRMIKKAEAAGFDADQIFLGLVAQRQAEQKHRLRNPVAWVGMKWLMWTRRRIVGR